MKKAILLLFVIVSFWACNKDNDASFSADPLAKVKLLPDLSAWNTNALRSTISDTTHLSALEIVKQATVIQYYNIGGTTDTVRIERGFDSAQRDTLSEVPVLCMWATDIISLEGIYVPEFIESKNCILVHFDTTKPYGAPRDTIGYIPNAVMRAAQLAIKEAYDLKDYTTVYKIFNEAFTFRPIAGAEYRALKATNQQ